MPEHDGSPDATIALAASGVTVLIDASDGRLPAVRYWGRELPGLDAAQAAGLARASASVLGTNNLEPVPRVAVLPEHSTGWTGRPGLRGSFAGSGWSPAFRTTSIRLDGAPVTGFAAAGPGSVEVLAVDDSGRLELRIVLELLPSGLLRGRAAIRNLAGDDYAVDDLVLALPVPAEAAELLDFAGRHNLEREPQRLPFPVGAHVRENRKGRTGADSAYVLHAGTPGFGFGSGEI